MPLACASIDTFQASASIVPDGFAAPEASLCCAALPHRSPLCDGLPCRTGGISVLGRLVALGPFRIDPH